MSESTAPQEELPPDKPPEPPVLTHKEVAEKAAEMELRFGDGEKLAKLLEEVGPEAYKEFVESRTYTILEGTDNVVGEVLPNNPLNPTLLDEPAPVVEPVGEEAPPQETPAEEPPPPDSPSFGQTSI